MRFINWTKIENCTFEERKSLTSFIGQLIELKYEFEQKGIEGFHNYIVSSANLFERQALQLIMQGYIPDTCEKVLTHLLNSSNFEGKEYLKEVIFAEFALAIQKEPIGVQELKLLLSSYLGTEFLDIQMAVPPFDLKENQE